MKKMLLTLAAAFIFAASAHAQLGVTGGLISTATSAEDAIVDIQSQNVSNYQVGLVYKIDLPFGFAFQPGLVYNMKGLSLQQELKLGSTTLDNIYVESSTGYLELPVQLQWGFDLGPARVYAFGEPYVGYAITNESKTHAEEALTQAALETAAGLVGAKLESTEETKWDGVNRLQYGVAAGVGVLVFNHLAVSAKAFWDMESIYTEDAQKTANLAAGVLYNGVKSNTANGFILSATLYF